MPGAGTRIVSKGAAPLSGAEIRTSPFATVMFGEGLDPALHNVDALLRGQVSDLPSATVAAIAKSVVEWLNV